MFLRELEDASPEQAVEHLAKAARAFAGGALPDDLCMVAVRPRFENRWYTGSEAGTPGAADAALARE